MPQLAPRQPRRVTQCRHQVAAMPFHPPDFIQGKVRLPAGQRRRIDGGEFRFRRGIAGPVPPGLGRFQHDLRAMGDAQEPADLLHHRRRFPHQFLVEDYRRRGQFPFERAEGVAGRGPPVADDVIGGERSQPARFLERNLGRKNGARIAHGHQNFRLREPGQDGRQMIPVRRCLFHPSGHASRVAPDGFGIGFHHQDQQVALHVGGIEGAALEGFPELPRGEPGIIAPAPFAGPAKEDVGKRLLHQVIELLAPGALPELGQNSREIGGLFRERKQFRVSIEQGHEQGGPGFGLAGDETGALVKSEAGRGRRVDGHARQMAPYAKFAGEGRIPQGRGAGGGGGPALEIRGKPGILMASQKTGAYWLRLIVGSAGGMSRMVRWPRKKPDQNK